MTNETALTHGDVERIVQLAEDAGFGYVHLEADGLEVTLVKEGYVGAPAAPVAAPEPMTAAAPSAPSTAPAAPSPAPAAVAPPAAAPPADDDTDDTGLVTAPMVGIFYRAPDPESPPYVEVGQSVEAGATVGLVEVMKMYTAVRTEVAGRVTEILVGNADAVTKGQPLVRIEQV